MLGGMNIGLYNLFKNKKYVYIYRVEGFNLMIYI